ncbi:CLUMA_CG012362, isoform A [Clunio marinus]|uniref:CLUMA_CG012362, isoform A n=1 Tax=Clunio marinus TaxID=568069 RepID=A0A1J1IEK9_9DIPT|nr:CLUMA_CG012362, isoform A [Clunio marinus]
MSPLYSQQGVVVSKLKKGQQTMINEIFLHMKEDEASPPINVMAIWKAHQVSMSISDPCPLTSRKSHFIAR